MARVWRIEYEGALYHILSRGNGGQPIFLKDRDRENFLETVSQMVREEMENVMELTIPLKVDIHWGKTWSEAH